LLLVLRANERLDALPAKSPKQSCAANWVPPRDARCGCGDQGSIKVSFWDFDVLRRTLPHMRYSAPMTMTTMAEHESALVDAIIWPLSQAWRRFLLAALAAQGKRR
jgi:hypothetical protein